MLLRRTGASRERCAGCHCASCRSWSAGPVNAFTLWKPDAVKVTKGQDRVGTYHKTDKSHRKWCKRRGGPPKMKDMPKEMGGSGATLPE